MASALRASRRPTVEDSPSASRPTSWMGGPGGQLCTVTTVRWVRTSSPAQLRLVLWCGGYRIHSQVCQRPQQGSLRAPGRGPVFLLLETCGSDGSNLDAVHPEMCSLGDWADRSQIAKEATMPLHYSAARYEHSLRTKRILRLAMEKLLAYEYKCVGIGSTCVASWIHRIAEQEYESTV